MLAMPPAIARCLAVAAMGTAAATSACAARPEVSSVGPEAVSQTTPPDAATPYVPAGTLLTVRLDQPLDSFYTAAGSTFTATVVTPLRDERGATLVRDGARLHGTFVSSGAPDDPRVLVRIDTVDTAAGTLPISAAVREAQHVDWVAPLRPTATFQDEYPYALLEDGAGATFRPPELAVPNVGYAFRHPKEVWVPRGALMELQLTRPLVVPR